MSAKVNLDELRASALKRIERSERQFNFILIGAAILESLFLILYLKRADVWTDKTHFLLLLCTVAGYTIVILGLFALGAHINKNTQLVLKAIALLDEKRNKE